MASFPVSVYFNKLRYRVLGFSTFWKSQVFSEIRRIRGPRMPTLIVVTLRLRQIRNRHKSKSTLVENNDKNSGGNVVLFGEMNKRLNSPVLLLIFHSDPADSEERLSDDRRRCRSEVRNHNIQYDSGISNKMSDFRKFIVCSNKLKARKDSGEFTSRILLSVPSETLHFLV
uniref:Uncharacterized protein n=1 Tax=Heterorhabditis bacteriophora TaxID=37862 RepID=A0A1I7WIP9_HETBA